MNIIHNIQIYVSIYIHIHLQSHTFTHYHIPIHTRSHSHTEVHMCIYESNLLSKDKVINLEMSFYLVKYSLVGFSHSYIQTSLCKSLLMAVPPFVFYANFILFPPRVHYLISKWIISIHIKKKIEFIELKLGGG